MIKDLPAANTDLFNALNLLSAPQIAMLAFGGYALFSDLHDRAQPKPIDPEVSDQLRTVNAEMPALEQTLVQLAKHNPVKILAVAAYLEGTTHKLGAGDMGKRLRAAVESSGS